MVTVPPSTQLGCGGTVAEIAGRRLSSVASKTKRPVDPCVAPVKPWSPNVETLAQ